MEESEKRRERLRAMRMEAQAEVISNTCSSSSFSLSNPLLERIQDDSHAAAPRFGFYTDPMAAFSSDKRRAGHQPRAHFPPSQSPSGSLNPEMPISGVQHFQNSYSPHQNMQRPVDPYYNPGSSASPMGIRSPHVYQGSRSFYSASGRGQWPNNSPSPGWGRGGGSPYPMHQGSPNFRSPPPGRGHWSNNSPGPVLGCGGSPSPNMGRGRGGWDGNRMSPGPRYSGGRGRGPSFDGRARSLYDKSMVEDPWESLMPVIWRGVSTSGSNLNNRTFVQRTPMVKKPRVASPFDTSSSNQSLAEFLAASFDEAVGDAKAE